MAIKCPRCNTENASDSRFCKKCATPLPSSKKITPPLAATLEASLNELSTGSTVAGRYQVIEELGIGGMGRVYKVFDTEIKEKVALKLLKPEIASNQDMIERFSNELKFARKISHRNVCRMYDLGNAEGALFITMEFVPGEDLKSFIRRSRQLVVGTAVSLAEQVCEGLAEAHRLGIVHRDLKPGNIMIDEEGNAKIMDFGIARSVSGKGITGAGMMIGTPEYMSPEQVEGKEADLRSDIYSLGVVLYEMLTGRVPFEGDTPFSVALKQKSEIPQNPRQIDIQIPEDLSRLVLKCLEKDREKRFESAEALASELAKISRNLPTAERKLIRDETPVKKPGKRVRWKHSIAVLPFRDNSPQKDQESICDGMTDELIVQLGQFQGLKVINTNSMMRYKNTEKDIQQIAEELGVEHILDGRIQKQENRIRISAQLINPKADFTLWSNDYYRELKNILHVQDQIAKDIAEALKVRLVPKNRP
jgi:serine/threonine protein kinase